MDSTSNVAIWVGRTLSALIVAGAIASGLFVVYHTSLYPRTDDFEILANLIGIAPQVEGPLVRLAVHSGCKPLGSGRQSSQCRCGECTGGGEPRACRMELFEQ
jgi:hypothetical protein